MKIYLAARYERRAEMAGYGAELEAMGHEITSRWISGSHDPMIRWARFAEEDIEDITRADAVVSFTENLSHGLSGRGGRHVEFGVAIALGKQLIVVGCRENVFHHLGMVYYYETWDKCKKHLTPLPGIDSFRGVAPGIRRGL